MSQPKPCPFCGDVPTVYELEDGLHGAHMLMHGARNCPLATLWFTLDLWNARLEDKIDAQRGVA